MSPILSVRMRYEQFFDKGGPPPGSPKVWHYRRRVTSMRLPGCEFLVRLVTERHAKSVLDIGSGITSHMLHALMLEDQGLRVVTTDTNEKWLRMTVEELVREQLPLGQLYLHDDFENLVAAERAPFMPYDVISLDGGNLAWRVDRAKWLSTILAPNGVIVLDDYGMEDYAARMTPALRALGFRVDVHPETEDEFGFYVATAYKEA